MKLSQMLIPTLAVIMALPLAIFNVAALTIASTTDFSVNVPDNWAYIQNKDTSNPLASLIADSPLADLLIGKTSLSLIPIEFSDFLVNTSKDIARETIENGGAYSVMGPDTSYPYGNVPLEIYTNYSINLSPVKVFSKENATVGGEPAMKVHRTGRNATNVAVVEYDVIHDSKPYIIQYVANVKDFQKYLPQFEQTVKTFKFIK